MIYTQVLPEVSSDDRLIHTLDESCWCSPTVRGDQIVHTHPVPGSDLDREMRESTAMQGRSSLRERVEAANQRSTRIGREDGPRDRRTPPHEQGGY